MTKNIPEFIFNQFETNRLILRKYCKDDACNIFTMYNDIEVMRFAGPDRHDNIDETKKFIESVLLEMDLKKGIFWAIVLKSENKVIGDISLCSIDYKHSFAFFGTFLTREYWRQGIIYEASKPVIRFAFEALKLNRLECQIYINNFSSIKMVEKLKFKREAELRENFLIEGKFQNSYGYSMLKSDYYQNAEDYK